MAEQTEQQKAEAAAKAAAEKEAKSKAEAEAAAKADAKVIVLLHELHDPTGKLLPAGTELDGSEAWVKRCVLPYDLWETRRVHKLKAATAAAVAEAERIGKEAVEKAQKGEV